MEDEIQRLERLKSEAVLNQDYEAAAEYRDQAEQRKKNSLSKNGPMVKLPKNQLAPLMKISSVTSSAK